MKISIDPGAAALLETLHGAGFAAYAVGGCVRDSLLGLAPHDWDLCTSARPEQVLELFGPERCIPTGLIHGTVSIKYGGAVYETTTFRTEGGYTDGRRPDRVEFVPDVRADLARRDFTINAMAYNAEEGLIDPFGGREDLARGLVRAVGEPIRRFEEDALRILRLYRFAARFGFAVDPATAAAARALSARLRCVSAERIADEITRLLAAPAPGRWMEPEVFAVVLPELFGPDGGSFVAACARVDALPPGPEGLTARLAALLLPLGQAETRTVLRRLRCSNALTDETALLVCEAEKLCLAPDVSTQARRLLGRMELPTLRRLTQLCAVLHPEQAAGFDALQQQAEQCSTRNICCRIGQLAVNGRDLMALGIRPGPELRRLLEELLEEVVTDRLPNEKTALLAAAEQRSSAEQEHTI